MSNRFRIGGSFTAFRFNGRNLLYLRELGDTGVAAVAPPQSIHPIGARHPVDIAFPRAHSAGTLTLGLWETWNKPHWAQLPGYGGVRDIIDMFNRNLRIGSMTCVKIIQTPGAPNRLTRYHGCVVTNINDAETTNIKTVEYTKTITVMYRFKR